MDESAPAQGEEYVRICNELISEVGKVVVGQEAMISRLVVGILTGGHVLLEGVPGLAKTLAINTLARAVHGDFSRIQFTPDMMPSDVIGTSIALSNSRLCSAECKLPLPASAFIL